MSPGGYEVSNLIKFLSSFVKLSENHEWKVGDMICSGISHPCTAFDKWKFIPVVDDDYNVVDGKLTYF